MTASVIFAPLVEWWLIAALGGGALFLLAIALWRGLSGWWLRGMALAALLGALANPSLQEEERQNLSDIIILVVDESASQGLGDRRAQTEAAVASVQAEVAALPNTELRIHRVGDGEEDAGTLAMTALAEALAEDLVQHAPAGLNHVYFCSGGSEAVEAHLNTRLVSIMNA